MGNADGWQVVQLTARRHPLRGPEPLFKVTRNGWLVGHFATVEEVAARVDLATLEVQL